MLYTRHNIDITQFSTSLAYDRFQDGQKSWGFGQVGPGTFNTAIYKFQRFAFHNLEITHV